MRISPLVLLWYSIFMETDQKAHGSMRARTHTHTHTRTHTQFYCSTFDLFPHNWLKNQHIYLQTTGCSKFPDNELQGKKTDLVYSFLLVSFKRGPEDSHLFKCYSLKQPLNPNILSNLMWLKMWGDKGWTAASCWPPMIFPQRNEEHQEDRVDFKGQGLTKLHLPWCDVNIAEG